MFLKLNLKKLSDIFLELASVLHCQKASMSSLRGMDGYRSSFCYVDYIKIILYSNAKCKNKFIELKHIPIL